MILKSKREPLINDTANWHSLNWVFKAIKENHSKDTELVVDSILDSSAAIIELVKRILYASVN